MPKLIDEQREVWMAKFKRGGWVYGNGCGQFGPVEFETREECEAYMSTVDPSKWRAVHVRVTTEEIA